MKINNFLFFLRFSNYYEFAIFFVSLIILAIGFLLIYSSSWFRTPLCVHEKYEGINWHFVKKQFLAASIGFLVMIFARELDYDNWRKKYVTPLLMCSIIFLSYLFVVQKRWISIGFLNFQPSELAKVSVIIYLAKLLSKKADKMDSFWKDIFPDFLIMFIIFGLIIGQPDFGMGISILFITLLLWIIAGARGRHLWILIPLFILMLTYVYFVPYARVRIVSFFKNVFIGVQDPLGADFQKLQAQAAFRSGKIFGKGLGYGTRKYYVPEVHTDYIFSVIGEELGLVGASFVLGLYCYLLYLIGYVAFHSRDLFGALLASGIGISISFQILINVCVNIGIIPTKGTTLPLISYGGSSLVCNMWSLGILQNIAKNLIRNSKS